MGHAKFPVRARVKPLFPLVTDVVAESAGSERSTPKAGAGARKSDLAGRNLARLPKERGYSQVELAEKMGIIQQLITAYEHDRLRLHAEMVIRFSRALDVSTDELLLGVKAKSKAPKSAGLSLKIVRRLQRIEGLPELQQKTLLKSIDLLLNGTGQRAT